MFTPLEHNLSRGWPGRIEGDRVIQLAAQTLQSFFTGGGAAREHAEYRLDEVRLRPPVLHPRPEPQPQRQREVRQQRQPIPVADRAPQPGRAVAVREERWYRLPGECPDERRADECREQRSREPRSRPAPPEEEAEPEEAQRDDDRRTDDRK